MPVSNQISFHLLQFRGQNTKRYKIQCHFFLTVPISLPYHSDKNRSREIGDIQLRGAGKTVCLFYLNYFIHNSNRPLVNPYGREETKLAYSLQFQCWFWILKQVQ